MRRRSSCFGGLPGAILGGAILLGGVLLGGCTESGSFPQADASGPPPGPADAAATGPTILPFAVDDWYGPSGYMGDGSSPGGITDETVCIRPRPSGWLGNCHLFTWTPGAMMWAGVYWQYPDGNWGDLPGLQIPSGATAIAFQAWGKVGGEKVSFVVGMMTPDGFALKKEGVVLGTAPQQYTIDLAGTSYGRVVGGFGWTAEGSTTPITFNVDDIRWQ